MKKGHLIFLHEKEDNAPITINAEYMMMALRNEDGDATHIVMYDYLENIVFEETDVVVNETPEKIFNMLPHDGNFLLLHLAEDNHNVIINAGSIIICREDDGSTLINLTASESLHVHETPMTIHNIVTTGRQYDKKAKKQTAKEEKK
jgi:hypothetical protein